MHSASVHVISDVGAFFAVDDCTVFCSYNSLTFSGSFDFLRLLPDLQIVAAVALFNLLLQREAKHWLLALLLD